MSQQWEEMEKNCREAMLKKFDEKYPEAAPKIRELAGGMMNAVFDRFNLASTLSTDPESPEKTNVDAPALVRMVGELRSDLVFSMLDFAMERAVNETLSQQIKLLNSPPTSGEIN